MPSSRFHTDSEFSPKIRLIKTLSGLGLILILFLFYIYSAFNPSGAVDTAMASLKEPAGAYVSAIFGTMLVDDGSEEKRVSAGDSLQIGNLYKVPAGSAAFIRFSKEDADAVIEGKAIFAIGTRLDQARLTLAEGNLSVHMKATDRSVLPVEIGALRLIPQSASRFEFISGRSDVLTIYEGQVSASFNESEEVYSAGTRLRFAEENVELEEFTVLDTPTPLTPASGTLYRKSSDSPLQLDFIWESVQSAGNYRFQISSNVLFKSNVYEQTSSDARITLPNLSQGTYYWRVTAMNNNANAVSIPSLPVPFTVLAMSSNEDEAVSAPDLELTEVSTQSKLISIRGKTEPGARVRVRMESFGRIILEPMEILVQSTGDFVTLIEAPISGQFEIYVEAYYRPEFVTTEKTTVDVDF